MRSLEYQIIQSQTVSQKLIMAVRALLGARRRENNVQRDKPDGGLGKNVVITSKHSNKRY